MLELDEGKWASELQQSIYEEYSTFVYQNGIVASALLLAGLQIAAEPFRVKATPAERKLIRTHYPDATDESIDAHSLDHKGMMIILDLAVTAARKYLDHQPETATTLNGLKSQTDLRRLVQTIGRNVSNSFAGAGDLNASGYDITAALITNTVNSALGDDVAPHQIIMVLLQNIERVIRHVMPTERH